MPSHELKYVFLVGDTPSPISIHPSIHPSGVLYTTVQCTCIKYEYATIYEMIFFLKMKLERNPASKRHGHAVF